MTLTTKDIRSIAPHNIPQWDPISTDLAERLKHDKYGLRTPAQQKEIDKIRASRWLLLTNEHGAPCSNCKQVHKYITRGCIERPFNGLHEIHLFEMQQSRERGSVRGELLAITETTLRDRRIGVPEPITRKEAKKLILRIRAKLGRNAI